MLVGGDQPRPQANMSQDLQSTKYRRSESCGSVQKSILEREQGQVQLSLSQAAAQKERPLPFGLKTASGKAGARRRHSFDASPCAQRGI